MEIELISAHSPKFNGDGTITLMCKFSHLGEMEVPFTASPSDAMAHGRDIHARSLLGEFGTVAPFIPPTAQEISDKQKSPRMQNAIRKVQHYEMMGDITMVNAWKQYYSEVYNGVIDPVEPTNESDYLSLVM